MAFGQIDPARLDGDALRQWYLRSPADIEEERRQAASRAHDAFFSQADDPQSAGRPEAASTPAAPAGASPSDAAFTSRQIGPNRFRSERAPADPAPGPAGDLGSYQLAAAAMPARGYFPIPGCVSCHGPQPASPPPANGPAPRPPTFVPRIGDSGGASAGGSRSDKPQCEQQAELDREVCSRVGNFRCWENLNARYAHCLRYDGEVGTPGLGFGGR